VGGGEGEKEDTSTRPPIRVMRRGRTGAITGVAEKWWGDQGITPCTGGRDAEGMGEQ